MRLYVAAGSVALYAHYSGKKGATGFGSNSSATQVAEKWAGSGQTVIVTGCSGGLGLESVRVLAARGAHVIMAVRDVAKVSATAAELRKADPSSQLTVMSLDLACLESVRAFAAAFLATGYPLNILLQNGAVMACPFTLSADGHEMQFATNHLGHFLLTHLLLEHMLATAQSSGVAARVVTVSSAAHIMSYPEGIRPLETIDAKGGYGGWPAYGQSKLANILFTRELNERMKGRALVAVCCHPGAILTNLERHVTSGMSSVMRSVMHAVARPLFKSIPQGAATQVYLATSPSVTAGEYYADVNVSLSSKHSHSRALGKAQWEMSSRMAGTTH
ncbi:MAG: hypothetical protein WDW38_008245 [Sanguina aurantia]